MYADVAFVIITAAAFGSSIVVLAACEKVSQEYKSKIMIR